MVPSDSVARIGAFDRRDRAEAAAAFLAGEGIEAAASDDGPPFRVAVPAEQAEGAAASLGLDRPRGSTPAPPAGVDVGDPWDRPLPSGSIWRRPPWMKLAVVVIVLGMLLPAVFGLLRVLSR